MSEFAFKFRHPEDLLAKLDRELERLNSALKSRDEQDASDHAINFTITAWSLCDWVCASDRFSASKDGSKALKLMVKSESAVMAICADLANGAKHFELSTRKTSIVQSTQSRRSGGGLTKAISS